jgi:hypothetical protein
MVSTTYGEYRVTAVTDSLDKRPQSHRGFFIRLMDALAESRQRAAMIEIAKHAHLLSPSWLEQMGDGASSRARRD